MSSSSSSVPLLGSKSVNVSGPLLVQNMQKMRADASMYEDVRSALVRVNSDGSEEKRDESLVLKSNQTSLMSQIVRVWDYVSESLNDYRMNVEVIYDSRNSKSTTARPNETSRPQETSGNTFDEWRQWDRRVGDVKVSWWCMNPAVAFRDVVKRCWSVVLTSGTLSPMDSFESELGTTFPVSVCV